MGVLCAVFLVATTLKFANGQNAMLPCSLDAQIRAKFVELMNQSSAVGTNRRVMPMFIRGVFHDSVDANNLLEKTGGTWSDKVAGQKATGENGWLYGGVDACLHSPLTANGKHPEEITEIEEENLIADAQHNRNLGEAYRLAGEVCDWLNQLAPTYMESADCLPDMSVFGALLAIEIAHGPEIPMKWGRKKGNCLNVMHCMGETCADADTALKFAPSLIALDDPLSFRKAFDTLGFGPEEQVALMGAHSFGKANVCVGGMNGLMRAPFCDIKEKLQPPVLQSNMHPDCTPELGQVKNCFLMREDDANTAKQGRLRGKTGLAPTYKPKLSPLFAITYAGKKGGYMADHKEDLLEKFAVSPTNPDVIIGEGFGDGGFWDTTPDTFDNQYYKEMQDADFDGKDVCCAGTTRKQRYGLGGKQVIKCDWKSERWEGVAPHNRTTGEIVDAGLCDMKFCRVDNKGRPRMVSPTLWHEASYDFVKKGWKHDPFKRIIRLAGDWALLHEGTKSHVLDFAANQDRFFESFKMAFTKVTERGYEPSKLSVCVV